ncbi:MAG: hypothetical protein J7J38_00830 [Candidatus Aenigmarchaeota archaeon]|nr:hypothetical protein [Candidatus Aenigmarchaeota archaeon]
MKAGQLHSRDAIRSSRILNTINYCILNEKGKRLFLQEYDEKLKTTIKHKTLGRKISYQRLIRLECYKLIKHLIGMKKFKAFRIWW